MQINRDGPSGLDVQNKLYNGKELDRMHGLDWYDYHARQYDAALGQFNVSAINMASICEFKH